MKSQEYTHAAVNIKKLINWIPCLLYSPMKAKHHRNYNYGKNNKTKKNQNKKRYSLGAVFDKHIKHEFQDHDVDATMKTMVSEPYVLHVPVLTGGVG